MMKHRRDDRLARAVSAALIGSAAMGATSVVASPSSTPPDSSDGLVEIVVSATRRDTSIQDIPYSISAISGSTLEESHVQSLSDVAKLIAGVSFVDEGPTSRSDFILRGINANATGQSSSQTGTVAPVSTYIGETPLFLSLHLDDIDRVEVLRGPQGTLYGSGSLAGTIRFIPNQPDPGAFHANIETNVAGLSETNQFDHGVKGFMNIPLNDDTAFRVSGGYQHYAGFIDENYIVKLGPPSTAIDSPVGIPVSGDAKNPVFGPMVFSPIEHANTADIWQMRGSFLFKPNEQFSALLAFYHQDNESKGQQAASPNFSGSVDTPPSGNPFYSPSYPVSFPTGGVVFPHNTNYDANDSFLLQEHRETNLASADLSYDLGFASLTSSTSFYRDSGEYIADNTGLLTLYPSFYGFIPRMVDYETNWDSLKGTVEEIRLVSKVGERFDYVTGLFYQHLQGYNGQLQWIPGQTYFGGLVGDPGANASSTGDLNYVGNGTTDFKDEAIFGELTYHATDRWQITGGARFFHQDFSVYNQIGFPFCGSYCGDAQGNTFVSQGYSVSNHISKLNTSYKFSDYWNVYFNYAEGFRRGGSSGIPTAGPFAGNPALLVFKPDETKNFEVGSKGTFGGVTFTAAVFYINWDNFQVDTTAVASGLPIAVNGSKAKSRGVELELSGPLFLPRLTYDLGFSYADATVAENFSVDDINASKQIVQIVTGRDGDPLPNSPKYSATLALDYKAPLPVTAANWTMDWHINGNYRSSTLSQLVSTDPQAPPPFKIVGFELWDASVTMMEKDGFYGGLFAQNIFNALAVTGGQDAGAVGIRAAHVFVGRPRTIGLRVGYRF
jgi:outer membrane receptor protein involved in Fe transport